MTENSEPELLARCRRGDAAAWDAIFDQHYPATGRFVFQLSPEFTRKEVEGICQEAFLSVIRYISSFQEESRFQALLFRVAAKKARDFREKPQTGKPNVGSTTTSFPPDANGMTAECMALVRKALDEIGDPCREIIELRYFGDLSYEDIGGMLSLTSNTVSTLLVKCLEQLQDILDGISSQGAPPSVGSDRNMDELLKACGKKRRDDAGAPMAMPAAIRQTLQAEVSKVAQQVAPDPPRRSWFLGKARPVFAYALFFALLITASSLWFRVHTSKSPKIDRNFRGAEIPLPEKAPSLPGGLRIQNAGSGTQSGTTAGFGFGRTRDKTGTSSSSVWKQQFARVTRKDGANGGGKIGNAEDVLNLFHYELMAGRVRVVDQDGSTYEGPGSPIFGEPNKSTKTSSKEQTSEFLLGYDFRVTGTNRTLNRVVVFEGKLVNPTEGSPFTFEPARIQGHARVGEDTDIQIEAALETR